jgi:membrane protease YdiL (CAAX protease family)
MLVVLRHAMGRLAWRPDPVLLLGREGRWRWPWVLAGMAAAVLLFLVLSFAPATLEEVALEQGWITSRFSSVAVFPFEPARPLSYLFDLLIWLPLILSPLIVLRIVHGVSWRRAFSYGSGFRWLEFLRAAVALLVVLGLGAALTYFLEPQQHEARWPGISLLPWIALGLGAVFVQTLAEDTLFLCYLHRTWAAVLPVRLPVAALVTTVFILGHLGNTDVQRDVLLAVVGFVTMTLVSIAVLLRTQNLAASAGLHWANNAFILLRPGAPEEVTPLALVVYTDPVYAAGGSYLYDTVTWALTVAAPALLLLLLLWSRSPFYLAAAPVSGVGRPARAAETTGPASPVPGS